GFVSLRKVGSRNILTGAGQLWFCAQMLQGDSTDNIPGLPGYGQVKVYNTLKDVKTYEEAMKIVYMSYRNNLTHLTSEGIVARLKEIAQLLWIKRSEKEKIFNLEEVLK